jgi:cellulose synthase (UDP-forming)
MDDPDSPEKAAVSKGIFDRLAREALASPWLLAATVVLALLPAVVFAFADLPLRSHAILSAAIMALCLWTLRRLPRWRLAVALFSICMSVRYVVWRGLATLALDRPEDAVLSLLLYGAELYGVLVLILGYFQTSIMLPRVPLPLPADGELPTVDVYVPTYNEGVDILRRTLIGARAIDWPRKTVYLLDDGRRPEMKALADELGVRYLVRKDNTHAKAGNINAALRQTDGEYIAIFDCDHVPVRSFLRLTMGFFLHDARVGLVQTPHHFYNPDPFERNLWLEDVVPPEQEMFYHAVQIGNDFWNSAFFCGSCAVLRRTAIESVGGIAVETVTEDAHTALRLHAEGWRSAYLDIPQAAGLATERYAYHVAQRMRWARGMTQILRLDNPLFKKGLTWAQRLNYLNAIQHFQFGIPRLVYLTAPAIFLIFGIHPLRANPWEVIAYAMPHVFLSLIGGLAVARSVRHAFWAEVYETSLAPYTALVTILAFVAPKNGKFNVTVKGTRLDRAAYDLKHAFPNLLVLALCVVALVLTPSRWNEFPLERGTLLVTAIWNLYNVAIIGAAVMVALERPQRRKTWRVRREHKVRITALDHPELAPVIGESVDLSEGGVRVRLPALPKDVEQVQVDIESSFATSAHLPGTVVNRFEVRGEVDLRVEFDDLSPAQEEELIELMFTDPDAWTHRPMSQHPLQSLLTVIYAPWRALVLSLRDDEIEADA